MKHPPLSHYMRYTLGQCEAISDHSIARTVESYRRWRKKQYFRKAAGSTRLSPREKLWAPRNRDKTPRAA